MTFQNADDSSSVLDMLTQEKQGLGVLDQPFQTKKRKKHENSNLNTIPMKKSKIATETATKGKSRKLAESR